MAEIIISQLDRAFANPLETDRQVNFISDRDAISALKRWEGMQVYVKRELTTFELRGGILNENWTDISGVDSANYTPTGGYTGTAQDIVDSIQAVTGGIENISITHIANLDYYVIANPYIISGNSYSAVPTTVTLTVGDATNARIDVIYADVDGLIGVLAGTPSVTPVKPIVSNTQKELTFRTVPALATVDTVVTNEVVFNENLGVAGGEMDVDGWNLTALNFNSTAVAFSGTKSIYFDGVDPYFNVDFKNDVNIAVPGLSSFFFRVYVTEIIDKNASFFLNCLDTDFIANGTYVTVKNGVFGFDRNVLNTWQLISVPITYFNLSVENIKGFRFMVSSINKPKMYIDTLTFQSNVSQPTPTVNHLRFIQLTDTPTTYSGQSLKVARVNVGETALEFDELTKSDVGLSNVDNTSDANKPVSTAQLTALDLKLDTSAYNQHFKGVYLTFAALVAAHPTASVGDYAQVNAVGATDVLNYNWDNEENVWIPNAVGGSGATNTDELPEGSTNLYHTGARVLATVLTGISFLTGTAIVATDSILVAFGKLQKQINDILISLSGKQDTLTNPITGTGTTNYIPKFTATGSLGDSQIFDNGTNVGIGTNTPNQKLHVQDTSAGGITTPLILQNNSFIISSQVGIRFSASASPDRYSMITGIQEDGNNLIGLVFHGGMGPVITERMRMTSDGNFLINTSTDTGGKLQVNGSGKFASSVKVGDNTAVASATNVGAIRYRLSGNNSYAEMCMQNGASSYIWTTLTVHSW